MKIAEILNNLSKPVPKQYISKKKKGNTAIAFVPVWQYYQLLDERCGMENWEMTLKVTNSGNLTVVIATLTIYGEDKSITRDGIGNEDNDLDSWGDATSNAESQAVRRVCAKFGLSRELWLKNDKSSPSLPNIPQGALSVAEETSARVAPQGTITREDWLKLKEAQNV